MQHTRTQVGKICEDHFWDINLTWYSPVPDFTQCFQQTVFVLFPCSVFSIIGIIHLLYHLKRSVVIGFPWTVLLVLKMILCVALMIISIVEISFAIEGRVTEGNIPDIKIYSTLAKIICYIVILLILKQNKRLQLRSSSLLSVYWFIFSICSTIQYASVFIKVFDKGYVLTSADQYVACMIQTPLIICQFILSLFNDPVSPIKRSFLEDSSFFSLITFFWFNKYLYKGVKKQLNVQELQPLSPNLQAASLYEKFQVVWKKTLKKRDIRPESEEEPKTSTLFFSYLLTKTVLPYFLLGCILQMVNVSLIFLPPLLLDKIITFISESDFNWKGYLYCGALFISGAVGKAFFTFMMLFSVLYGHQVKSIVISTIYRKAINLSSSARRHYTSGEIVNLMSVDVENLYHMAVYSNLLIGAPIKLTVTIAMLWRYLGPSCLAGVAVLVLMMLLALFITTRIEAVQEKQMKTKDLRLKHMSEILNGMKVLKLHAWETPFIKKISEIRKKEVKLIRKFQLLFAGSIFVWNCGPLFVGIASLVTYALVDKSHVLNATIIFVSMNLLDILQNAVLEIPELIAQIAQTKVSLARLIKFLVQDEHKQDAVGNSCAPGETITIQNGTFSWSADGEPTLADINLHIPSGSLVAVTGPVGSGKSSLLSAILGEIENTSGTVDKKGTVAFVPQQAWILNRTVRENILFVTPMNRTKYDEILDGCCLKPDLEILPGGDKTEIGEKGVNLSGGQKQRVSLARAIFHDADLYLLDDPLSAVDSHVGKYMFDHVIGKTGLLRNKTRMLVTHNISVLPETDFIVTMKDGKIQETGTYQELMESDGVFADFIAEHSNIKATDNDAQEKAMESTNELVKIDQSINHYGPLMRNLSVQSTHSVHSAKLMDEENMEVGEVKNYIYLNYAKHIGIFLMVGILFGFAATTVFDIGLNIWLSEWSADSSSINGTEYSENIDFRVAIYAALGLCQSIANIIAIVCLAFGSARAAQLYHKEMLWSIMRAPMAFFDTTPLGRIINRFGSDIDDIDIEISGSVATYLVCVFHTVGTLLLISTKTPLFLAFLVPVIIIYFLIQKCYLITSRQLKRLYSTSRSPIYSHFTETANGTSSVRAYGVEDYFIRKADEKLNMNIQCQLYYFLSSEWLELNVGIIGELIVLIATLLAIDSKDVIEAGVVGLILTFALSVKDTLTWLIHSGSDVENKFISIERIEEYSNIPSEAPWIVSENFPPPSWPTKGKLKFKGYSTRYREGLDLVIKDVNLNIEENEKVGIVGRTGAGKSSITLALFRIIEPAEGTVLIDGIDISQIGLHQLRSKLTIIPQDPVLFTGPLRMNLDPNHRHSDEELWLSLESAHLKEFVSSLSEGLNFEIAEGGDNLSVGQRQLVCLARALLKQAKFLILDEATAAVDMDTDRLIQNTIRSEFKDYTVITIAHRLNTIMDYDKVVVMDSGKIVEVGHPTDLLQRSTSQFYSMAKDAHLL